MSPTGAASIDYAAVSSKGVTNASRSVSLRLRCSGTTMDRRGFDPAETVARARAGDEQAASDLVERLYPLVIKVIRAHLPRRTSEDDLAQIVFMKVFANLDRYSGLVPVEHWVSRITVNTCINELKSEKRRPEWRWADMSEAEQHILENLATGKEAGPDSDRIAARELLGRLLDCLSASDRLVIQLLHLEEQSVAEVKAKTGWSEALIKVRAFRARRKLRKHLKQLMEGERP